VCEDVPDYITQPYTCYDTETVSTVVKDYDVNANVVFNFGVVPAGVQPNTQLNVNLDQDQVSVTAKDKQLVLFAIRNDQSQVSNGVLNLTVTYNVLMASVAELLSPLSQDLADFAIKGDNLTFTAAHIGHPDTILPHLKIKQGDDLIDADLAQAQYQLTDVNGRTQVTVPLTALGVKLNPSKKVDIKVTLTLVVSTNVLNPETLSSILGKQLKAKATIKP
jgi:hypothetical protein